MTVISVTPDGRFCIAHTCCGAQPLCWERKAGEEVGKQLSLEKLESFRNQKKCEGGSIFWSVSRHAMDGRKK